MVPHLDTQRSACIPEIIYFGIVLNLNRRPSPLQTTLHTFWRASSSEAKARLQTLFSIQREKGWSKKCKKVPLTPSNQAALSHFDKYYSHIFGVAVWSGIRAALLTPPAKVAVLNFVCPGLRECVENLRSNNYLDLFGELSKPSGRTAGGTNSSPLSHCTDSVESVAGRAFLVHREAPLDQMSEFLPPTELVSERDLYARDSDQVLIYPESDLLYQVPDLPMVKEEEEDKEKTSNLVKTFRNLRCFAPPCGMFSALPKPMYSDDCFDFYPLDLGSVLAVLMLDVQPGTRMLDLCSAPGGKAVTALQTLNLERLLCTDVSASRLERLHRVLAGFAWGVGSGRDGLPDVEVATTAMLQRLQCRSGERFSRVLVDVPCSTDRDALTAPAGGYFARGKAAARVKLVEKQRALLQLAMSLCEVGGYVVYSTCTLSTAQNQAVIEFCFASRKNSSDDAEFAVVDSTEFVELCTSQLSPTLGVQVVPAHSATGLPLGAMVLPCLAANYGPSFICKIKRLK
ncbi:5-methylcytosine rRNA methyltransferase NSUN4 [Taenia crassiceps]|uniref:NOL1/NOP2/Sun domain family member 4 n=1 Tax=Taenia crassiceps TaxID=6207 RepID=A0ABR4QA85_9CEST